MQEEMPMNTADIARGRVMSSPPENLRTPLRASAVLLALAGVTSVGMGVYFIALRPSLLPEDIRFMELSAAEVSSIGTRIGSWLTHVFRVLGGYAMATGLMAIALAATAYRDRRMLALVGAVLGGASSIGMMVVVNFAIDSDFKWLLLGFALLWASSLVAYGIETRVFRPQPSTKPTQRGNAP
jgi:hypothetical protein